MHKNVELMKKIVLGVFNLYYDGFKNMRIGKKLWILILVKVFVMFVIIKWLFFPDILQENFSNDTQRGDYILNQLTTQ